MCDEDPRGQEVVVGPKCLMSVAIFLDGPWCRRPQKHRSSLSDLADGPCGHF